MNCDKLKTLIEEDIMATITIDDDLIKNARSVTTMRDDTAIVQEALQGFILDMKSQAEAKDFYGKLHWDADFAGMTQTMEN
jgi:hypothetical protein